jgi:hypothetical protein
VRCITVIRSLYFRIFSASFFITFVSPEIATSTYYTFYIIIHSTYTHIPSSLSQIMTSGLTLGMVLSVCMCSFHNMVTLYSRLVFTDFGTCSYQGPLSNFTPISLHMLERSWTHTLIIMYCSFANIGHADTVWSIVCHADSTGRTV